MKLYLRQIDESINKLQEIRGKLYSSEDYYDSITKKIVIANEFNFLVRLDNKEVCDIICGILQTDTYNYNGYHNGKYFSSNDHLKGRYFLNNRELRSFVLDEVDSRYPLISAEKFIERFKDENI